MEVINKKLVIIVILIGILSSILMCLNISDKETKLEMVSLNNETKQTNMFAIMLEEIDEEGNSTYVESTDNVWPTDDTYVYDITKSGCIDTNGNKIENALEYDLVNNIASVKTEKTSYCYLYFSKPINLYELCEGTENMSDCLSEKEEQVYMVNNVTDEITGGMYRYQGSYDIVNNNYICFGASSVEDCIGSEYEQGIYDESKFSKYMYRIIGITSDGNLKLLKKEALEELQTWDSVETSWPNSIIYNSLNGEGFLENNNYLESNWNDKILEWEWKYGIITTDEVGQAVGTEVFEIEDSWTNKTNAKVGLMYLHDYFLSYSNNWNCYSRWCSTAWLYLTYNDAIEISSAPYSPSVAPPSGDEWLMSVDGIYNNQYRIWYLRINGQPFSYRYFNTNSARPVFYTRSDIQIISGDGTANNPYIIS